MEFVFPGLGNMVPKGSRSGPEGIRGGRGTFYKCL